jgi:hypothetical protein
MGTRLARSRSATGGRRPVKEYGIMAERRWRAEWAAEPERELGREMKR